MIELERFCFISCDDDYDGNRMFDEIWRFFFVMIKLRDEIMRCA